MKATKRRKIKQLAMVPLLLVNRLLMGIVGGVLHLLNIIDRKLLFIAYRGKK